MNQGKVLIKMHGSLKNGSDNSGTHNSGLDYSGSRPCFINNFMLIKALNFANKMSKVNILLILIN